MDSVLAVAGGRALYTSIRAGLVPPVMMGAACPGGPVRGRLSAAGACGDDASRSAEVG